MAIRGRRSNKEASCKQQWQQGPLESRPCKCMGLCGHGAEWVWWARSVVLEEQQPRGASLPAPRTRDSTGRGVGSTASEARAAAASAPLFLPQWEERLSQAQGSAASSL